MKSLLCLVYLLYLTSMSCRGSIAPLYNRDFDNKVPGEWILLLREEKTTSLGQVATDITQTYSTVTILGKYEFGSFRALRVSTDDITLQQLRHHMDIILIEANAILHLQSSDCLHQSTGSELWGLSRIATRDPPTYSSATYNYKEGDGEGVDVYIADSGIYLEHPDFEGRAVWGMTVSDLADEGDLDLNGHGTHVASTVGGKMYGVAKKARLIAVKMFNVYGQGSETTMLEGFEWILTDFLMNSEKLGRRSRSVINFSAFLVTISPSLDKAIQVMVDMGLQIIMAAGNNFTDACLFSPGRVSSGITVGAIDSADEFGWFSNYGSCVDILAPGENITSAYIENDKCSMDGTSMAAPHVTGMVARFLSQHTEGVSPHDIKAWLLKVSSMNKINLREEPEAQSTPNRLLYGPCNLGISAEQEETGEGTSVAEVLTYIMFPLLTLNFIAASVAAAVKVIPWVKGKVVNGDAATPYVEQINETNASQMELSSVT